jgi:long-chain acyl-CoA synthetase
VADRGGRLAAGLVDLGVAPGDRVAMVLSNCPEVLNGFNACFRLGAWAMPVLFTLTAEEMGYVFKDATPRVIVTEKLFLDKVREAAKGMESEPILITVGMEPTAGCRRLEDIFESFPPDFPVRSSAPDDIALLIYTSGSTGAPKGVMLSHDNLYFTALASAETQHQEEGEVGIGALPLNHSFGIITNIAALQYATRGVLMRWFDDKAMLSFIERFRAQATAVVPTMLIRLLANPDAGNFDLSSMRRWITAAAPLHLETRRRFEERFPGKVLEGYGLSECSPTVAVNNPVDPYKDGSVGRPLKGVTVGIRDALDRELPPGKTGEICVSGRNVMKGYYHRPEATAATIRDGWLHTGDVGFLDADGYLFITDRIKDLIIRGGENIYPKDIEDVLVSHPKVGEAAVIAMPDAEFGEEVMAVVTPRPGQAPTVDELMAYCREKLARFQTPKRIELVLFLPKSPIGKVLKKDLRKQYFGK